MSEPIGVLVLLVVATLFYLTGFIQGYSGGKTHGRLDALIEDLSPPTQPPSSESGMKPREFKEDE